MALDPSRPLPQDPHPDLPVLGSLAGTWCWDLIKDRWEWSDEVYVIHGFQPRQVVPTTDLVLSHKHPEDLAKVKGVLARAYETGSPFACQHRIYDARGQERTVLAMGGARTDENGNITALSGFMTDLTDTRRRELEPLIKSAIDGVVAHRAAIEQAKGAITATHGISPDAAFDLLRAASSSSNTKVRTLARELVDALADPHAKVAGPAEVIRRTLIERAGPDPVPAQSQDDSASPV